jgi:hypothetical protein
MKKVIEAIAQHDTETLDVMLDDVESGEDAEERLVREAVQKPAATFRSVFGPVIFNRARGWLSQSVRDYAWTDRERDASWPETLLTQVATYARHPLARDLRGTPTQEVVAREIRKAQAFRTAYEAVSGVS